jgi:hypothetical protein
MVKLELLSIDGVNTNWDVYYFNNVNGDAILFADNIHISPIGDWVELDIPSDWVAVIVMPKDNPDVNSLWYSGSV